MIPLLWGILNITLLICFLVFYIKVVRLVREKMGGFAAVVLILSLFCNCKPADNQVQEFDLADRKPQSEGPKYTNTFLKSVTLEEVLSTSFSLDFKYRINEASIIPMTATSTMSGFICGLDWEPKSIIVDYANGQFHYYVDGSKKWKLFGIEIFSQSESYEGKVSLSKSNNNTHV